MTGWRAATLALAALLATPALGQEADPIGEALREAVLPPSAETAPPAANPVPPPDLTVTPPPTSAPVVASPAVSQPGTVEDAPVTTTRPPAATTASPPPPDSEEAEDALPTGPTPYTPQITAPRAPAPYRPSRSEAYTYEGYDARLRSSFASAQGLLGTLDGGWTLVDAANRRLFAFQLVDKGAADGTIEGVWRDLRRTPTPTSSGLIGTIQRVGSQLTLTFAASRGGFTTLTLARSIDGSWGGRLKEPDGENAVSLRRD